MQVGLYLDGRNPGPAPEPWADHYARTLDLAVEAERLGAHAVWLSEHHDFDDGYLPQPLTLAAAIAARTGRIRVGTAVVLAPLRHPKHLAEEAAVVDLVSGGRLELGLGAGYRAAEFAAFGASLGRRFADTERVIAATQAHLADLRPPTVQRPLPMWGGFFGPRGAELAGRLGLGLLSLDRALLAPCEAGLASRAGDDVAPRLGGHLDVLVADDPDAAWARLAPHVARHRDSYADHAVRGTGRPAPPPSDPARLRWTDPGRRSRGMAVLTAPDAVRWVRRLTDGLPVTHVYFWARVGAMPLDLVERHVELVSTVLAPELADAPAPAPTTGGSR